MNTTLECDGAETALTPDVVHAFWFGDTIAQNHCLDEALIRWFRATADFDDLIRRRFASAIHRAGAGEFDDWCAAARGRTALIVLLDQLPRNAFRGTPQAFAFDAKARAECRAGIACEHDHGVTPVERHFFYLPLLHSESVDDQQLSVASFERLRGQAPASQAAYFQAVLDAAHRYHSVVARFGRFPHRNVALGRASTAEEIEFMAASTPRWSNGPRAG